mgnify:CR=1 FL=1|tara:strand:- start:34 stop:738 length:705 start_codon:yes stop_codon:yes gene_type:complete
MKQLFLIISFILLTLAGFTQDRSGYIGISLGPSFPVGDYAATSGENAGYADRGFNMSLVSFCYKFGERFGVAASWYGIANPPDGEALVEGVGFNDLYFSGQLETSLWSTSGMSAGLLVSFPYTNFDLDIKTLIGFAGTRSPELKLTILDGFSSVIILYEEQESNIGLSLSFGGAIRYYMSEKWALSLNLDYFTTSAKFPEYNILISDGTYQEKEAFEQNISALSLTLGIGYRLK